MKWPFAPLPAFHSVIRHWPYILLFFFSLIFFMTFFYFRVIMENRLAILENQLAKNGIIISEMEISRFPPALHIQSITFPPEKGGLKFTGIEIVPALFPISLSFSGKVLKGTIKADVEFASILHGQVSRLVFDLARLSIPGLFEIFREKNIYVKALSGIISASGNIDLSWKGQHPDWSKTSGIINVNMSDCDLEPQIQLLNQKSLANSSGIVKLRLVGQECRIEEFAASSGDISLAVTGTIKNWYDPPRSELDLETSLRVPPRDLNENLIPPRTLAKLKENGAVHARLGRSLSRPSLHLVN